MAERPPRQVRPHRSGGGMPHYVEPQPALCYNLIQQNADGKTYCNREKGHEGRCDYVTNMPGEGT